MAPRLNRSSASLASSTKNEPSTPCGRPTRPTMTSSLLDNLEHDAAPLAGRARADDRAKRPGDAAGATDHLAAVGLRHVELEHRGVLAFDRLDAHGVRVVD